jgi:hypothetical protein
MFIQRYGRVFPTQRDSHLYVTPVTTLQYIKDNPEVIEGVRLGDRIYHSGIQGGIGLWAIVMTLFLRRDAQQAEQFTDHLTTARACSAAIHCYAPKSTARQPTRPVLDPLWPRGAGGDRHQSMECLARRKSTPGAHVGGRGAAGRTVSRACLISGETQSIRRRLRT